MGLDARGWASGPRPCFGMNGRHTDTTALACGVSCTEDDLVVRLVDGRVISVPLTWFPRLLDATAEQRRRWELLGGGVGIHWPDVDEDLSVEGLLWGAPAPSGR